MADFIDLIGNAIASDESFGLAILSLAVSASGIPSDEVFGAPSLSLAVSASGIPSDEVFGTPSLAMSVLSVGVSTGDSFGNAVLQVFISASGIGSEELVSSPSLVMHVMPAGVSDTVIFGTPQLSMRILMSGIPDEDQLGSFELLSPLFTGTHVTSMGGMSSAWSLAETPPEYAGMSMALMGSMSSSTLGSTESLPGTYAALMLADLPGATLTQTGLASAARVGQIAGDLPAVSGDFLGSMFYERQISPMSASMGGVDSSWTVEISKNIQLEMSTEFGMPNSASMLGFVRGFRFDYLAGQRITVDQQQGGSYYPFVHGEVDEELRLLISDFYLMYSPACNLSLPLKLTYVYGFGAADDTALPPVGYPVGVNRYDVVVEDSLGNTVVDTTTADVVYSSLWGARLEVIEWHVGGMIARMVVQIAYRDASELVSHDKYISPVLATLQSRVAEPRLPAVAAFMVGGVLASAAELKFTAGNNVNLASTSTTVADGARYVDSLTFHGDSGGGLGKVAADCQATTVAIHTISGVAPAASGAFYLSGDDCYRIQHKAAGYNSSQDIITARNSLNIKQLCVPCCSCDQFIDMYEAASVEWSRLKSVGVSLEITRNYYRDAADRYTAAIACHKANPITIQLEAFCSCKFGIAISFCGWEDACVKSLELRTTFTLLGGSSAVADAPYVDSSTVYANTGSNSVMRQATVSTSYPEFNYSWDKLLPYVPAVVRAIVLTSNCEAGSKLSAVTIAYVDGNLVSTSQVETITSIRLNSEGKCV